MLRVNWRNRAAMAAFPYALGGVLLSAGCGGSEEVVRAPAAKVQWGSGEAAPEGVSADDAAETEAPPAKKEAAAAPAKPAAPSEEEAALAAGAIDLDAPAERAATPAPAAATAKAASGKEATEGVPGAQVSGDASASAPPPLAELQRRRNEKERSEAKGEAASAKKKPAAEPAPEPAASAYKGPEPCRAASFSIERVRSACENGGRPGAKRVMKDAINKATATGQLLKCGDCHSNTRDYSLKSDAVDKLQRWLGG